MSKAATAARDVEPAFPVEIYRPIVVCVVVLAVTGVLFYLVPDIDLTVSSWFYTPGSGFASAKSMPVVVMRNIGIWFTVATITGLAVAGVWWARNPKAAERWPSAAPWLDWSFLVVTMAVGPGILVHLVFKHFWGRARPVQIEQFGGLKRFTPAWVMSDQCGPWNCSFVSGEAAASAIIVAISFVVPDRWRIPTLLMACIITLTVSFARLAAGGHFLSDVVTAWLLMLLVVLVLRAQMYHGMMLGPLKAWKRT